MLRILELKLNYDFVFQILHHILDTDNGNIYKQVKLTLT